MMKIRYAAAFRLQRFFRLLVAKFKAKRRLDIMRVERVNKAAKIITRFIRYIRMRKFSEKLNGIKRVQGALVIQCCARIFLARMK